MKAVRLHDFGGPEVLTYEDVPDLSPAPGEVLVDIKVIGVNYSDTHFRRGGRQLSALPIIPGHDGGGLVVALGEGVSTTKIGDRVAFAQQHARGSYKELMAIPASEAVPVPSEIDLKLAVAVMHQAQTAHYLSHDAHPIKAGERVLIHAGAGGVGSNLIQMAKSLGATVYTTVSTDEKAAFVRELGADEVCFYTQVDFEQAVKDWTDGKGVDVVFDSVGGDVLPKSQQCLARKGHLVSYGQSAGPPPPLQLIQRSLGSHYLSYHAGADYSEPGPATTARAQAIFRSVREGELRVHIHKEYALADAAQAHRDIESRSTIGKLLLIP